MKKCWDMVCKIKGKRAVKHIEKNGQKITQPTHGKAHDTALGPDEIHYQILKHIPEASRQCLLEVFDNIWEGGEFPPSWREATIIPSTKPGRESKDANNYRPIALTSCVSKTIKRMINDHLVWLLESSSLITEAQMDHLVYFETYVRENKWCLSFFDLEKAYVTNRKYRILRHRKEGGYPKERRHLKECG